MSRQHGFNVSVSTGRVRKPYGFFNFLLDVVLVFATGGLWIIWIFIRQIRSGR